MINVFFILIFMLPTLVFSQHVQVGDRFVEFIVPDIDSYEKARKVDMHMRKLSGVYMSRMDFNTGRYYGIFTDEKYTEKFFADLFDKKGMKIYCFYEGSHGKDAFIDMKRDNCEEYLQAIGTKK